MTAGMPPHPALHITGKAGKDMQCMQVRAADRSAKWRDEERAELPKSMLARPNNMLTRNLVAVVIHSCARVVSVNVCSCGGRTISIYCLPRRHRCHTRYSKTSREVSLGIWKTGLRYANRARGVRSSRGVRSPSRGSVTALARGAFRFADVTVAGSGSDLRHKQ